MIELVSERLNLGKAKYGHGVRTNMDTTTWGTPKNSWIEFGVGLRTDMGVTERARLFVVGLPGVPILLYALRGGRETLGLIVDAGVKLVGVSGILSSRFDGVMAINKSALSSLAALMDGCIK